ncbi:outer membrane lipid asymmetry maintenance protein MlaD [Gluconobacter wancherniae]|uniref:Outer membrane lipid asymmetry maintenance protein MlaD n=1 Tax=Gluconobacter wancherniae NBRC 103581 TaxID=656744 RepID=A0A511B4D5_9PROT|nr:outer membrane lipid asymmetry maintenance protein MlaD [Gluconobacter wancherniae]MBF0854544.1 outer membrane lipid asymmetry maintenance protein MlaD [Gluconobacter wancherniae]MBS1062932.1 outer membrane lipid asymmetry maintenance protein MlaD [Gluconobacter wancherniae]MBS1089649.1 outer membrane lipid asymmetry maintenance protein MlaD [Gluconobacter wancherniae]MBS1095731.1 outer membrane lipid asymmetry maintenance protein MlaD [Gluconobacter wancherniae]GBD57731.1 outer membrane li
MTAVAGTARANARHDRLELLAGLVVLLALAGLLVAAMIGRHQQGNDGYPVLASFSQIDGLNVGSDVRLAGITVGHVTAERVDPKTFQAQVTFSLDPKVKLPTDSAAIITSDSLLGGKYIALSPGGADSLIKPGGTMTETQGSISLEQLLSKFIFSVTDSLQKSKKTSGGVSDQP